VRAQGGVKGHNRGLDAAFAAAMGCADVYSVELRVSQRERDWEEGKGRLVRNAAAAAAAAEVSAGAIAGTSAGLSAAEGPPRVSGWSLWCPCDGFEPDTSNAAR
jgi:hypothetical protein